MFSYVLPLNYAVYFIDISPIGYEKSIANGLFSSTYKS